MLPTGWPGRLFQQSEVSFLLRLGGGAPSAFEGISEISGESDYLNKLVMYTENFKKPCNFQLHKPHLPFITYKFMMIAFSQIWAFRTCSRREHLGRQGLGRIPRRGSIRPLRLCWLHSAPKHRVPACAKAGSCSKVTGEGAAAGCPPHCCRRPSGRWPLSLSWRARRLCQLEHPLAVGPPPD